MVDKILAVLALLTLVGFLGILVRFVPRPDLAIVVALCVGLAAVDFYLSAFRGKRRRPPTQNR